MFGVLKLGKLGASMKKAELNPRTLFSASEPGAWYDPSDMSTLFQDSAGTVPVTAVEQPVGLMLDKSRWIALGLELVTGDSATFTSGVGSWAIDINSTIAATNGELAVNAIAANGSAKLTLTGLKTGAAYVISCTARAGTSSAAQMTLVPSSAISTLSTSNTNLKGVFFATSSSADLRVFAGTAGTFFIDNVSVRELPGNHATQATTTKRPVLSRRVNLLTKTEQFDSPEWSKGGVSVVAESSGGAGYLLIPSTTYATHLLQKPVDVTSGAAHTLSIKAKQAGYRYFYFAQLAGPTTGRIFDFGTGTYGVTTGTGATYSAELLPDGFWLLSMTFTPGAGVTLVTAEACSSPLSTFSAFTGDGVSGALIKDVSLTLAVDAHLPYQRVNTATDYDADPRKFPAWWRADGVDDSLASSTGGGGTTGLFFSAAIRPQGSAGTARTLFSDAGTNTGYIVRLNISNQLELSAGNGTAYTTIATAGALNVGATDVVQAWDDGTTLNVKLGSGPTASIARPVVVAGTAGYTLYQDNGAPTGYFNGRSYGEIYRKDSGFTQSQREAVAVYQRKQARIA